jgi:uncharacterized protein YceK
MKKVLLFFIVIFSLAGMSRVETLPAPKEWTVDDSKSYARESMLAWQHNQWLCLDKLWTKESNWRPQAYNRTKIMGKNAGGIPQILGLSPDTNPTEQIDRGFDYISYRYGTPCNAWKFWQKNGWY